MVQRNVSVFTSSPKSGAGSLVWAGTVAVAAIVVVLTASTPWVSAGPRALIEMAFQTLCHQRAERSFIVDGIPFAVCQRCFGIYTGIFLGLLVPSVGAGIRRELERNVPIVVGAMLLPMAFDWGLDVIGVLSNTPVTRYVTGLLAGAVGGLFLGLAFYPKQERADTKKSLGAVS